jgi:starvation-inducible outer membrane lipoprotein
VQLAQVTNGTNPPIGTQIRWGGTIHSLQNENGSTVVQVRAYQLDDKGRPQINTPPLGSFLAQATIPFDTTTYAQDRKITVVGTVNSLTQQVVAEKTVTLPVVEAENIYMWGESAEQNQAAFALPQYRGKSRCHYVYEGHCYSYSQRHSKPWSWYSSLSYGYRRHRPWRHNRHWDSWYGYWWPRSYIHFGFYSD